MSVIFGIHRLDEAEIDPLILPLLASGTHKFAQEGTTFRVIDNVGMGFQPYRTHLRSNLDTQPTSDPSGNLLVLDGRLDNWMSLCRELELSTASSSDAAIMLAAFARWGEESFSRLIGDWALALFCKKEHRTYLARDHAGARSLYFHHRIGVLQWSTFLETFFVERHTRPLDNRYAACFLGNQSVEDLTPYQEIRAVPPAHYLIVEQMGIKVRRHWNCIGRGTIVYGSDHQYEEHFRSLLMQSVERRSVPGAKTIAQLSGGMDSTSIVCMSDWLCSTSVPHLPQIDTVSFYDDTEPNWNEKPYFSIVEARRGKKGIHISLAPTSSPFEMPDPAHGRYLLPGKDRESVEREQRVLELLVPRRYRAVLSGVGGDEVLGGVPTPFPELADLLASCEVGQLFRRSVPWCLTTRKPLLLLLNETIRFVRAAGRPLRTDPNRISPWIAAELRNEMKRLKSSYVHPSPRRSLSPSSWSNELAWWSVMENLPHLYPGVLARYEYRYPYLDRDLVEFLFNIPPEQLVRPGRRRSLMRRALNGIVPPEILERRRKAFTIHRALAAIHDARPKLNALFRDPISAQLGLIEPRQFSTALDRAAAGDPSTWWHGIVKTIAFELWLRSYFETPFTST